MRIIHFSDIHAGGWIEEISGYFDKRLLGALNFLIRRRFFHNWKLVDHAVARIKELQPDVVVCTGDIATISEKGEFERSIKALTPLVTDPDFDFIYVPGNHDLYVKSSRNIKYLEDAFNFLNGDRLKLAELPTYIDIKNCRFLLVNEACPEPFFSSAGRLDKRTQAWLKDDSNLQNKEVKFKILVGHFPLFDAQGQSLAFRRRCHANEGLQNAFLDGRINISLCGHIHHGFTRWEKNGGLEVCAGSLTKNGLLNLIEYASETDEISQKWIDLNP